MSASAPSVTTAPSAEPMSGAARVVNTFIAPTKTFTDLKTHTTAFSWFAPWLVLTVFSIVFAVVAQQKVGFRQMGENGMKMAPPSRVEQMEKMPAEQRERAMNVTATIYAAIAFAWPVLRLIGLLLVAAVLLGTFNFGAGAELSFSTSLAVVMYAALPELVRSSLATASLLAGSDPESFNIQNPVATNIGYFLDPRNSRFLWSLASYVDVVMIWTLVLAAIGFACVSRMKRSTTLAAVFGWYIVLALGMSAIALIGG